MISKKTTAAALTLRLRSGGGAGTPRFAAVIVALLLLTGLSTAVFAQVRGFSFLEYDDDSYITKNSVVLRGFSRDGLRWAFTTFHAGNWHPLTWCSHMVDTTLFGSNPAGHHLHNLALHLITGGALFLVLAAMTGAHRQSWLVAALFSVHPLHVEPVVWVAERKELLSAGLGVAALALWLRYARRPSAWRYALVCLLVALALAAKPMAVTLPLLFLLLDVWPLGRLQPGNFGKLIMEKVPLAIISGSTAVLTILAQAEGGALLPNAHLSLAARAANAITTPFAYLRRAIAPADLNVFYPHPGEAFSAATLFVAAAAFAAVTAMAAAVFRTRPFLLVGWLWYLIALFPVNGLVQAGLQSGADRYTYVPLTGILVAVVWTVGAGIRARAARILATSTAGLVLLGFAAASHRLAGHWRDEVALFSRAVAIRPADFDAHAHLGSALLARGLVGDAVAHLREAARLCPRCPEKQSLLADALASAGKWEEAVEHYRRSLEIDDGISGDWNNLGVALVRLGRRAEARACFLRAREIDSANQEAWNNLGGLLASEGIPGEALRHFEKAIEIDPGHWRARANRAALLRRGGRTAEALKEYREVLRLKPDHAGAREALGLRPGAR